MLSMYRLKWGLNKFRGEAKDQVYESHPAVIIIIIMAYLPPFHVQLVACNLLVAMAKHHFHSICITGNTIPMKGPLKVPNLHPSERSLGT